MNPAYTYTTDLRKEIEIPQHGILSRTFHNDEVSKCVLFGFAEGEELSEHTASTPAIIHVLQGSASIALGDDRRESEAGSWMFMQPHLKHSIKANTPLVLLLILLKAGKQKS